MTTLLDFLQATPQSNDVWNYVSASRLNLWMRCPLAFKRRYLDGVITPQNQNFLLGKIVHKILEIIYVSHIHEITCDETNLSRFVQDAWNHVLEKESFDFDDSEHEEKCRNIVHNLAKAYIDETNIANEVPVAVEKRYETPLIDPATGENFGIPLVGIVDLVLRDAEGLVVTDFKTAASASYCELQHELQLTAYAYLVRQSLCEEESSLEIRQIVKTKTPKIVVQKHNARTDEHFSRFFSVVREYLDALDRGVFNYRPSWNCGMCEHSGYCSLI